MSTPETDVQREVTRIALAGVEQAGFALAGSGAIREHGVTDRPTEDVDLFTANLDPEAFERAVDRVVTDLRTAGYDVDEARRVPQFARLNVRTTAGLELDVDMGVDWREYDPVTLDVGPVLSLPDAIGNKVSALYSRGEARDYLDLDAIRASTRFTDEELLDAAAERDPGFDSAMFAQQLDAVRRLQPAQVARYGISGEELEGIKARCVRWAGQLQGRAPADATRAASLVRAAFPMPASDATQQSVAQRPADGAVARRSGQEPSLER